MAKFEIVDLLGQQVTGNLGELSRFDVIQN
jgi:hypothetical protein